MTDKKFTDEEIIEALDLCTQQNGSIPCYDCPRWNDDEQECKGIDYTATLDLITRQQAKIEEIVGNNDKLNIELQSMRSAANSLKMHYEEVKAEIERLSKEVDRLQAENKRLSTLAELGNKRANDYRVMRNRALKAEAENESLKTNLSIELDNFASEYDYNVKAEAYKEFAERLKEKGYFPRLSITKVVFIEDIDKLLKEMVGEDNA